jgi:hypothetical protein
MGFISTILAQKLQNVQDKYKKWMDQSQYPHCHSFPPVKQYYYQVKTPYQITPAG